MTELTESQTIEPDEWMWHSNQTEAHRDLQTENGECCKIQFTISRIAEVSMEAARMR